MEKKNIDEAFLNLLNSFSSEIAYKILNLYSVKTEGINLTDTANEIKMTISTVRDNLNRLIDANLIFRKDKDYYLSNFGSFVLKYLQNLEIFNKARHVFGQIPAELIPSEFIQKLVPYMENVEIKSDQWQFMSISNRILTKMQNDLDKGENELQVIGWNSLVLSLDILKNYFNQIEIKGSSLQKFLENTNFYLISDKEILKDLEKNNKINEIIKTTSIKERIYINPNVKNFQFTLLRYNQIIQFFLNEENFGFGHHFVMEDSPEALQFFENVFNYYQKQSKTMSNFL